MTVRRRNAEAVLAAAVADRMDRRRRAARVLRKPMRVAEPIGVAVAVVPPIDPELGELGEEASVSERPRSRL